MTNKEASFLLGAYRPNGADATDAEFAEALQQAGRDPKMSAWFADQRRFDSAIAKRVQSIAPPADLRARILTGVRVSRPARSMLARRLWAMAATIMLLAGLGIWFSMENGRQSEGWEDQALAALTQLISGKEKFDATSANAAVLQQWLKSRGAPYGDGMPTSLRALASLGCKQVSWNGHEISIICFQGPGGELVHLAMMDSAALQHPPPEGHPVYESRDGWQLACWSQGGTAMMLATLAPQGELEQLLGLINPAALLPQFN